MDYYRDDGFDRSSQCIQEILQLIALNSRHCNTFRWRRELNGTENGKVLHEKVLKKKDCWLALSLHPTPLSLNTPLGYGDSSSQRQPNTAGSCQCGNHVHTESQHSHCHLHHEGTQMPTTMPLKEDRVLMLVFLN